jgi:hypothetical protein
VHYYKRTNFFTKDKWVAVGHYFERDWRSLFHRSLGLDCPDKELGYVFGPSLSSWKRSFKRGLVFLGLRNRASLGRARMDVNVCRHVQRLTLLGSV